MICYHPVHDCLKGFQGTLSDTWQYLQFMLQLKRKGIDLPENLFLHRCCNFSILVNLDNLDNSKWLWRDVGSKRLIFPQMEISSCPWNNWEGYRNKWFQWKEYPTCQMRVTIGLFVVLLNWKKSPSLTDLTASS